MPICQGVINSGGFVADRRIRLIYLADKLVYQYDNIVPVLTITSPTGMSAEYPTYVQGGEYANYTVAGMVSDADSGVKSVIVNGYDATIIDDTWSISLNFSSNALHTITIVAEDNAGNVNTVVRYLYVEPYYKQAAKIAGITEVESLDELLGTSEYCSAIAENEESRNIMKTNYAYEMTQAIDDNWNEGLNSLNYICKLRTYVIKDQKSVNGWTFTTNGLYLSGRDQGNYGICSNQSVDWTGYSRFEVNYYFSPGFQGHSGNVKYGFSKYYYGQKTGYDTYYKDNVYAYRTNASPAGTYTDSVSLEGVDTSYVYPFVAINTMDVNEGKYTTYAHINDLILDQTVEQTNTEAVTLSLTSDTTDAVSFALVDEETYGITNVTINEEPTATKYNFEII